MKTRTNIIISCVVGIAILSIFALRDGDRKLEIGIAEEQIPVNEKQYVNWLVKQFQRQIEARDEDSRILMGFRDSLFTCVHAEFSVVENLRPELAIGIFQPGAKYPAWVRFSNNADPHAAGDPDVAEMAIKLGGVPGEKLHSPYSTDQGSHDLLLSSKHTFAYPNVETYAKAVEAFSSDQALKFYFNPFDSHIKLFVNAKQISPLPENFLNTRWWSDVAYSYGENRAVKYSARPCRRLHKEPTEISNNENQHEALKQHLRGSEGCFEFLLQFQTDAIEMPIEDPSVVWNQSLAPFEPVALLTIDTQDFHSDRQMNFCENLSYNPWRALIQHRPLGGINRARREIYKVLNYVKYSDGNRKKTARDNGQVFNQ